mgnify:CR=1 FL=1
MDITIDCGNLFFGLNNVRNLEDKMFLLKQAMSKISVSSELPSAASFETAKKSFNTVLDNDIDDLVVRLDNTKRILTKFDREAAYLFNYYEEGIINGDFEFTEMPLMSQTDYNDIAYSQGTIKTSGCGLTSVCMVASYLTGNLYTPSELVGATRGHGDNVSRMLAAASSVGLKWHNDSGTSHDELDQYLRDGKIAIVLVKGSSHFVVCTGITEDGKYLVNDPYGPWAMDRPISRSELKFTAGNTWIFDPAENQGVKGELDDSITVEGKAAEQIINESGFVDRTDRGEVPTDITQVEGSQQSTEPRTEPRTEAATEPRTEAATESRTEPRTEPKTEPRTETKTEPRTEAATETRTEPRTEPKTEPRTEAATEAKTEPRTEAKTEPRTEAATEARTEPRTESKTEPRTEAATESRTEPRTEQKTEPRTEAATEARTEPKTEVATEVRTEPRTEAATEARTERPVENKTESTTVPKNEPVIEENTQSTVTDIPVEDYEEMTEPSMEDESMDDIYEDINTEDNSTVDYDDFYENRSESSEEVTSVEEKNNSDTNLLIPGLAVAAGAAAVGGIAYAANSKKKNNEAAEEEEEEETVSDKFSI